MSNCYYDATGVMKLKKLTPVIKVLFDMFCIKFDGKDTAYIQDESEGNDVTFEVFTAGIIDLLDDESIADDTPIKDVIVAYAATMGKQDAVRDLLGDSEFDEYEDVDVAFLFDLARILDDGHGFDDD